MVGLFGTIWPDSSPMPSVPNFVWKRYERTERVNPLGEKAEYRTGSSGLVQTIIIPGRGIIPANKIRLYSLETMTLSSQTYKLNLRAIDGSTRGDKGATLECLLHLTKNDADMLEKDGAEVEGIIQSRISFRRIITTMSNPRTKIVEFESDGLWNIS